MTSSEKDEKMDKSEDRQWDGTLIVIFSSQYPRGDDNRETATSLAYVGCMQWDLE